MMEKSFHSFRIKNSSQINMTYDRWWSLTKNFITSILSELVIKGLYHTIITSRGSSISFCWNATILSQELILMATKYLKKNTNDFYLWRSLSVYFRKFKNFELIKIFGEGWSYKFIKLKMRTIFFESL